MDSSRSEDNGFLKPKIIQKSKSARQIFAAVSATLILIASGFHIGWASPSLAKLQAKDADIFVTSSQGSWIASFLLMGSIFGTILALLVVDRWGRKTLLLLMSIPLFVSCVLIALAQTYWWFYLARFTAGIGNGAIFTGMPIYVSEIAEDRMRGAFGILATVMMNLGTLVSYGIGPWVSRATLAMVGAIVPVVYALTFIWMPETPYYFAMKSVHKKSVKSLRWLREISDVTEEVKKIRINVTLKRKDVRSITELCTVKGNQKALVIMIGLLTCQQASGITAISAYSTIIFNQVDSGLSTGVFIIILGIVKLTIAAMVIFLADVAGRRPLLLTSISLSTLFLFAEAVYFHLQANGTDLTSVSWLPLVAMIAFLISYTSGMGTIPMVTAAEIFPCEVKALAMTAAVTYMCAAGICVTKLYQIVSDAYGIHVALYIFTVCSTASTAFIFLVVPETKRRSLNEIQDELHGVTKPML
ncbi:facilitated trehalose transporter Tret1-2 homolog isoform X1 [Neodiprion lecontei]|uniref:Facilitated trehalose transporter Tret1-2 homolog isoform X1 n=2 Tax=Neodiprion lecontei TaxID=441921 RepID=A0A6J0BVC1_NEOLC|nr:facilitated trehalose transporter Tret1-2 homolog isoform X1 [Neodiprion lecontei]XP_046595233.1 facilitated trehalose transporter Tret1-2 homolog isoform X1 [Neodiprion lecontei]XP_046595234.1 facilitated trehalose transporter Tret1-2 homolog isoform X1 [Neodiprion lecontei]